VRAALYSDGMSTPGTVRWGILGPGKIARAVVRDFVHVEGAEAVAVASRSLDRARSFADEYGLSRAYGSYAGLLAADDLDAVYIATPHPQHHALALAAIEAGLAVLVEKTFTATVAGAEEVVAAARRRSVFAMEAMWTRFQPAIVAARALVDDGAIGEVRQVQADLGVDRPFDPTDRMFDLAQGGGALLDLGVYVVSFAQYFLGTPDRVVASGSLAPTGVDAEAGLLLGYADGRVATLLATLRHHSPGTARIQGTTGWIEVPPRFHHPHQIVLHRRGAEPEVISRPPTGGGYAHELIEVTEAVAAGRTESAVMPLEDTLAVQRVLADALEQLGVVHAEDPGVLG
jgi:predicted dehydrogenase